MESAYKVIDQVRQETLAAFSNLIRPAADRLIGPTKGDVDEERQLRNDLAGKDWMSLDAGFLSEKWSSFCYLSPEGYRYYLPALLVGCLDDFVGENPLVHSTLYFLQPSFWMLYFRGEDKEFLYQNSLFSPLQYGAVCSFLGLVFDLLPQFRFSSAKALKWGWNRQAHPALLKSREFYQKLHHYQYPQSSDPVVQQLIDQIHLAFDSTPYPGDNRLCGSSQGDEPAEYALEFRGLDWRAIHPDYLSYHYASLNFFSNSAFRYFLPAYLVADLLGLLINGRPIFHLTHGLVPDKTAQRINALAKTGELSPEAASMVRRNIGHNKVDWYQVAIDKFSHFTLLEKKAIVAYLKYSAAQGQVPDRIQEALDRYWLSAIAT
jgi:hypothetical protein